MKSTAPREPRKVTVIPAVPKRIEPGKSSHQKLRVAAYCRVSTDSEEQINSYKNQLAYYTEKISSKAEWKFAGIYADEGITGTSMKHREDFKRKQLQSQLEGVQAVQKNQAVDEARIAEIAALLEKFKESEVSFDDLLVRKVVETVRVESASKLEITFKDGNRKVVTLSERGDSRLTTLLR